MSLWRGMGGSSIIDYVCLGISLVGIIGWKVTGNPLVAVLFSVMANLAAYVPAYIKTWRLPQTESPWFYIIAAIAAFLSLIAYKIEAASVFQVYVILSALVMIVCIYHKELPQIKRATL